MYLSGYLPSMKLAEEILATSKDMGGLLVPEDILVHVCGVHSLHHVWCSSHLLSCSPCITRWSPLTTVPVAKTQWNVCGYTASTLQMMRNSSREKKCLTCCPSPSVSDTLGYIARIRTPSATKQLGSESIYGSTDSRGVTT